MRGRQGKILCDQRGAALLTALVMMGLLSVLAAAYAMNVRVALSLGGGMGQRRAGFYAAEAGLNVGITRFANKFRDRRVPEGLDFQQQVTVGRRTVEVRLAEVASCAPCERTRIPAGEMFAGFFTVPYRYTVQSKSGLWAGEHEAHVAGEFDVHNIPIFQFLAFIDGHLFIMPLPDATLHGRIHTNSDLYMQPDNTLRIEDDPPDLPYMQVTAGGDIYRGGYKYNDSWRCWGSLFIDKLEDTAPPPDDLDPLEMQCQGTSPLSDVVLEQWKGSVQAHVDNLISPQVGIIDRGSGPYWERADLRIALRLDVPGASVDFSAPDLCPNTCGTLQSPVLAPIDVLQANGAVDIAKTRSLWRFMCERRGAIFYTDVPNNPPSPPLNNWQPVSNANSYTPAFASDDRVFRRAGEDTDGDGALSLWDGNDDICPAGGGGGCGPVASPWWRPPSCPWPNSSPVNTSWFQDMDYRRGGFWNHREQQWMTLLNVNMRALIEWNEFNGDPLFPHDDISDEGLVVFLTVQGPDSDTMNNYGVRLLDSADLDMRDITFPPGMSDPTGLTVVSDQAILIEGNYNKRDKYPAAVLADAIWILSQGWERPLGGTPNDLKSAFNLSTGQRDVPSADWPGGSSGQASWTGSSSLAINAALLFGLGPSTKNPGWYNGGLENFPRFLESWQGKTLNYRGSFVSLGEPQHKLQVWQCGSGNSCNGTGVYDPPTRAYDFDVDFEQPEHLPPMTPKVVFVQQQLYTRIYN